MGIFYFPYFYSSHINLTVMKNSNSFWLYLLGSFITIGLPAQTDSLQYYYQKSVEAHQSGDHKAFFSIKTD
jgi:hypothetical protein